MRDAGSGVRLAETCGASLISCHPSFVCLHYPLHVPLTSHIHAAGRRRVIACTLLIKLISTQKTFSLSVLIVTRHLEPIVCCRTKSRFDCAMFPTHHIMCPDDHQDGMRPPCQPHYIFSMYVSWPEHRHSEPLILETRENRLSAHVICRPRPSRQLQSQRKVTTAST